MKNNWYEYFFFSDNVCKLFIVSSKNSKMSVIFLIYIVESVCKLR